MDSFLPEDYKEKKVPRYHSFFDSVDRWFENILAYAQNTRDEEPVIEDNYLPAEMYHGSTTKVYSKPPTEAMVNRSMEKREDEGFKWGEPREKYN